jgi:hypothetical protein
MSHRGVVLAVALLGVLAGCAAPAPGPTPSASPALAPPPGPALRLRADCERNGGVWHPQMGYCEY